MELHERNKEWLKRRLGKPEPVNCVKIVRFLRLQILVFDAEDGEIRQVAMLSFSPFQVDKDGSSARLLEIMYAPQAASTLRESAATEARAGSREATTKLSKMAEERFHSPLLCWA